MALKFFLLAARSASTWTEISLNIWHWEKDLSLSLPMGCVCCVGACLPSSARLPVCAAPEGQPEVRAKGSFPELPGGSLCLSCHALPWPAVTDICCKGFRAIPQVAESATGEWGSSAHPPDGSRQSQIRAKRSVLLVLVLATASVILFVRVFPLCLWRAGPLEFLNLPFSCPLMSFLPNLELNSCIKNHRWEIIPKLWCYLFVCPTQLSALVLSLWPTVSLSKTVSPSWRLCLCGQGNEKGPRFPIKPSLCWVPDWDTQGAGGQGAGDFEGRDVGELLGL